MARSISFGEIRLDVQAGRERPPAAPQPETPFRIAVLGDFSGRSNRALAGGPGPGALKRILIDRDNLDDVMAKLGVRLSLRMGYEATATVALRFRAIEDFEPDRIYQDAALFQDLRQTREQLADAATFEKTAAQLGLIRPAAAPGKPAPAESPAPEARKLAAGNLLEEALEATVERTQPAAEARAPRGDDLSAFLRQIVAPYAVADPHPKQRELLSRWDAAISGQMRAVLHHPDFQTLEAAWRGLFLLVRRLETGADLKVYLIDLSRDELERDLSAASGDLRKSRLCEALAAAGDDSSGDEPWALVVGNYSFGPAVAEAELLGRIAKLAHYLRAPWMAHAQPQLFGCESPAQTPDPADWKLAVDRDAAAAWEALRALPESRYVGLAAPRILLRLPWGRDTVPVEEFPFEEISEPRHDDFLWGNPAFACATMLGEAFSLQGWEMHPGLVRQLDGLPLYAFKHEGETRLLPCAEALLSERAADAMLDRGVMPLLSVKGRDAVAWFAFRSIAQGGEPLAGPWAS